MGVLPGSHRGPLYDQYAPDGKWAGSMNEADVAALDLDQMVYLGGPAGSVTVHNCCKAGPLECDHIVSLDSDPS